MKMTMRNGWTIAFTLITTVLTLTAYAQNSDLAMATDYGKAKVREVGYIKLHKWAEVMPEYPGGATALSKYIAEKGIYPIQAIKAQVSGTVPVEVHIDESGKILRAQVLRSLGFGLDEEALRLVSQMPDWEPAKLEGMPVSAKITVPIRFRMADAQWEGK